MNYIPGKLLKLRKHYGYSQSKIADVLKVDAFTYMNFENGNEIPNYETVKKLATFYHVSVEEIFADNEEITLHDTHADTTDELNIKYFTKKSFSRSISNFVKRNKLASGLIVSLLLIIIILFIYISNSKPKPLEIVREDINRLSASNYNVIYIDKLGGVKGTGDNSNSQISELATSGAMKVCEGDGFTITLKEDGTVSCNGWLDKYSEQLAEWTNIKSIACGKNHVIGLDNYGKVYAVGDNQVGQCDVDGTKAINRIYALDTASVLVSDDGLLTYKGSFIGSSNLKKHNNILDIDCSDNILVILNEDSSVAVYSKDNKYYSAIESLSDVKDVCCGNEFVAVLKADGSVAIDIDNDNYRNIVANWKNIIAISAGNDYLVGFDGENIYGIGKNEYGQFKSEVIAQVLPMVSNVVVNKDDDYIYVQFDGVSNAIGYSVSIDVGTGLNKITDKVETVKFAVTNMQIDTTYTISIVALGEGDYSNSASYEYKYLFKLDEQEDEGQETTYTIGTVLGKDVDEFKNELKQLGIDETNIVASVDESEICSGNKAYVVKTNINKGEKYTVNELKNKKIKYSYCKIEEVEQEPQEENIQEQQ